MKDTFLMIDGNSLLHRAFHALPLMDAGGVYTNAIYGFLTMMLKAISDENARYLAVCFDEHAPTFRHTAYPDYKAGRAATPDELRQQFATIRTLLPEMGIQVFSLQGWEADDLLGTVVEIDHGNDVVSVYANLDVSPAVGVGQTVACGATAGAVGTTALAESGEEAHLHFAMRRGGSTVDPAEYVPET